MFCIQAHELNGVHAFEGKDIWRLLESLLHEKLPAIFVPPEELYCLTITLNQTVMISRTNHPTSVRGRLLVSESVYESPYNSVHDLHLNRIGNQFFI
jgi:hypothetical protein